MKRIALLGALVVVLMGCVPSLESYYLEKDLTFDPKLVGEWQTRNESDQPALWEFEQAEGKSYKLTVTQEKTKHGEFVAHLFNLGKENFLDLLPNKMEYASDQADLVGAAMFPGHLLLRVSRTESGLKLAGFDFDWLRNHLDENPRSVGHHKESGGVILTGSTADLQKFVLAHLGEGELFAKWAELARKGGAAQ